MNGGGPGAAPSPRPLQKLPALKTPNIASPSSPGSVKRPPVIRPTLPPLQPIQQQPNGTQSNGMNGHTAADDHTPPSTSPSPPPSSEGSSKGGPPALPAFVRPSTPTQPTANGNSVPSPEPSPKFTHPALKAAPPPAINPTAQNPGSPQTNGGPPSLPPFQMNNANKPPNPTPFGQISSSGTVPTKQHPAFSAPPPKPVEIEEKPAAQASANGGWNHPSTSGSQIRTPGAKGPPPKVPDFGPVTEEEDFDDDFSEIEPPAPSKVPPSLPPISTVHE